MNLTKHFTLEEFTHSESGARHGIDNVPECGSIEYIGICRTAMLMERIRTLLGVPIIVTSGYRNPMVNKLVGGSVISAHMLGLACDFIAPGYGTPLEICEFLMPHLEKLDIDQLIYEYTWIHIGLSNTSARFQVLTLKSGFGYVPGIVPVPV